MEIKSNKDSRNISSTEVNVIDLLANMAIIGLTMFAFYLQFHGKYSPGGGFQSGIIMAMAIVSKDLIHLCNRKEADKFFISTKLSKSIAILGVTLYGLTGLSGILLGGKFFDYSKLSSNFVASQQVGIFSIEMGVGLTVFGAMALIYTAFRDYTVYQER